MNEIGNQQVTDFELGWLAGILDGEGNITMRSSKFKNMIHYSVGVGFTNTSEELLNKVSSICSRLGANLHWQKKAKPARCLQGWDLSTRKISYCRRILEPLLPFLTSKRIKAELALAFCKRRLDFATHCRDNGWDVAKKFPYTKEDLWYFDEFKKRQRKSATPTTIPQGSRVQENPKCETELIAQVI